MATAQYTLKIIIVGDDRASAPLSRATRGFGGFGSVLGGILASKAILFIGAQITKVATEALRAASAFQTLEIRFEGLIAREIAKDFKLTTGELLDMEDALVQARQPAQELLEWIKQIAVTTPFTVENLSQTLATAQAMGFTTDRAKEVTTAVGNFTAGMGLTDEVMQRVIYNLGQMQQQGKVTGTELRDLARGAFVPVTDVLERMQENLGETTMDFDAFRKKAAKGAFGVEPFIEAFVQMANEDFPGAMERMSMTWQGVTGNIKDFIGAVLGVDLLGPVVNRFTENAAQWLQDMMTPEMRDQFKVWGQNLLEVFDTVSAGVGAVVGFLVPIFQEIVANVKLVWDAFVQAWPAISEMLATVWNDFLMPIFTQLVEFFTVKIPEAIDTLTPTLNALTLLWMRHLRPAIQAVAAVIKDHVIPFMGKLANFIKTVVIGVLKVLASVWENVLWPAIKIVINFIKNVVIPIVTTLAELFSAVLGVALDVVGRIIEDVLVPAFKDIQTWVGDKLTPALERFNEN
ncbi:MAG: tape measure protein, partial [Candidatus Binatia bacterium]